MLWKDESEELDVSKYQDGVAFLIDCTMGNYIENSHRQVLPLSLLYPVFALSDNSGDLAAAENIRKDFLRLKKMIRNFLKNGMTMESVAKAIDAGTQKEKIKTESNPYDRAAWSDDAAEIVEDNEAAEWDISTYVENILEKLKKTGGFGFALIQNVLDTEGLLGALSGETTEINVFDGNGKLNSSAVSLRVKQILDTASKFAEKRGEPEILLIHILYVLLEDKDGYVANILRRLPAHDLSALKSGAAIKSYLWNDYSLISDSSVGGSNQLKKELGSFSGQVAELLEAAAESAGSQGNKSIDERQIFMQILNCADSGIRMILNNVLKWPVQDIAGVAERLKWNPLVLPMPENLCECANLSLDKSNDWLVERTDITGQIIEILYNPTNHNAALFGESGVGKTTVAYLLAKALKTSKSALLQETPVIYLNLKSLPEDDMPGAYMQQTNTNKYSGLPKIFNFMEEHPRAIYVLDGMNDNFSGFVGSCINRLAANEYKIVLIMNNAMKKIFEEYKGDQANLKYVEIEELSAKTEEKSEVIKKILEARIPVIEEKYNVEFAPDAAACALRFANDYLMAKRFPQKAVALLENVASVLSTRTQLNGGDKPIIKQKDLAENIAQETGLPVETILGTGQDKDFSFLLSKIIAGQDHAVAKVADRLDLIQKGMVDANRPAAIFLFAGLSGTGKTELAKQIASVYSSSHKIITYEMNSFKESHATSRIIGVPPGYHGYDEGGKLINDINKDPYSLILFDEVEKAHPSMWDPLMRLFDEGVVEDTRGVTAYGNRAFFVLTSNIGQFKIVEMLQENRPIEEIEKIVEDSITQAVHEESGQKCFRQEFIGRITRSGGIVIFNALSYEALEGITRRIAKTEEVKFESMRNCKLSVDDEVIKFMASAQFEKNRQSIERKVSYFGARPLNPLFDDLVMKKLAKNIRTLSGSKMIRVVMDGNTTALVPVNNNDEINEIMQRGRSAVIERVTERLDRISAIEAGAVSALSDAKLARLDAILAEAGIISGV